MNILDENILEDQRQLLLNWRVSFRQISYEVGWKGMKDDEIIPFLLTFRQPTLFTVDRDFYRRELCHAQYSLVYLDVAQSEAAAFMRRLLRQIESTDRQIDMLVYELYGLTEDEIAIVEAK